MGQWLKAIGGYTVEQIGITTTTWPPSPLLGKFNDFAECYPDYFPSGMTAFAIASTLVCATWTDATRSKARWPVLIYMSLSCIIASICLLVWSSPTGLKFFAYCESYSFALPVFPTPLILTR